MTFLSRLHPYPAMIAEPLASAIAKRYVSSGAVVLDPFCGTGRTLVAAVAAGASMVIGVDVNPLAAVIARAKFAAAAPVRLRRLAVVPMTRVRPMQIEARKVPWFSKSATTELSSIIAAINRSKWLTTSDRIVAAAVLSATARTVSYCRKNRWKLHRLPVELRPHRSNARAIFSARLLRTAAELADRGSLSKISSKIRVGDSRQLAHVIKCAGVDRKVDVVVTSPPYGDSFTTVEYGGLSSICLNVIRHITGIGVRNASGADIDGCCLGGRRSSRHAPADRDIRAYWAGGLANRRRAAVLRFLADFETSLVQMPMVLRPRGMAIIVVGRRSAGGFRLQLDKFVIDVLRRSGMQLVTTWRRRLRQKLLPGYINRLGRSKQLITCRQTSTMRSEYAVVLRK